MTECRCDHGQRLVPCPVHGVPLFWNEGDLLRAALETIVDVNRKVDNIMSNTDQLSADVQTLVDTFGTFSNDLATGLTNLHAQIAGLEGSAGDAQALQQIGHSITGLIERAQQANALVKAADPGAQPEAPVTPSEPAPVDGPLPDETVVAPTPETPESPASPPIPSAPAGPDSVNAPLPDEASSLPTPETPDAPPIEEERVNAGDEIAPPLSGDSELAPPETPASAPVDPDYPSEA